MEIKTISVVRYTLTLIPVGIFIIMHAFQHTNPLESDIKYLKEGLFMAVIIGGFDIVGWVVDRYFFKLK
ncbi:MAG: hypothetical protein KZQ94_20880 [Candidatus Thiodiazotropha sp. (ex Troendleina suluensis)]|nr:hypothetical protein [Candidatus Thiodiazotropha sp. (ex Troendleina suluensis)]